MSSKNKAGNRWPLLLICTLLSFQNANAQFNRFKADDGLALGSGLALNILLRVIKTENRVEIDTQRPFNFLESRATKSLNLNAKTTSDWILKASLAGDVVNVFSYNDFESTWYLSLQNVIFNDLTNVLAKKIFKRKRPFLYNTHIPTTPVSCDCKKYDKLAQDAHYSFYSGHTAQTAGSVFFTNIMLWHDDVSFSRKSWYWIATAAIPAYMGYLRVKAGKHFASDVAFGLGAGAVIGYLVPILHSDRSDKELMFEKAALGLGAGLLLQVFMISLIKSQAVNDMDCTKYKRNTRVKASPILGRNVGFSLTYEL